MRSIPRQARSGWMSSKTSGPTTPRRSSATSRPRTSNRKVVDGAEAYTDEFQAEYGRFPKTLIFAANDLPQRSHADQIVELAKDVFGQGEGFVAKITGRVDRPLQKIRKFRNRPEPQDRRHGRPADHGRRHPRPRVPRVPSSCAVAHPVRADARPRHAQVPDLVPDKTHFTVFDCFDGTLLEYFRNTTGMTVEPPEGDGKTIEEIVDDIWQNRDRDYNISRLVKRLQRIDKDMSGEARELFSRFIPGGDVGGFAEGLRASLQGRFRRHDGNAPRPRLPRLCIEYPRARQPFIVAARVTDTVESEWLIKAGFGKEYKPADYLGALRRVRPAHEDEIQALRILLDRPQRMGRRRPPSATRCPDPGARALHRREPAARLPGHPSQGTHRHHLDGEAGSARRRRRC